MTTHSICCVSCGKPQPGMQLVITKNLVPPQKALQTRGPCTECLRKEFKATLAKKPVVEPVTPDHLL